MRKHFSKKEWGRIMEFRNLLNQVAMQKYNELNNETQLNLQRQYDEAKYDRKIQKMGGTFEDFIRFMFDLKIIVKRENGQINLDVKPFNKHKIIKQKIQNLGASIKKIKDDYSIKLTKYKNGDIPLKEFGLIYKACKKSLSIKQRELNKLEKFSKNSSAFFSCM